MTDQVRPSLCKSCPAPWCGHRGTCGWARTAPLSSNPRLYGGRRCKPVAPSAYTRPGGNRQPPACSTTQPGRKGSGKVTHTCDRNMFTHPCCISRFALWPKGPASGCACISVSGTSHIHAAPPAPLPLNAQGWVIFNDKKCLESGVVWLGKRRGSKLQGVVPQSSVPREKSCEEDCWRRGLKRTKFKPFTWLVQCPGTIKQEWGQRDNTSSHNEIKFKENH